MQLLQYSYFNIFCGFYNDKYKSEIIITGFGENNVLCPKYIDIYEFRGSTVDGPPYITCLLFKNQIPHHFHLAPSSFVYCIVNIK